jgi:hypothetical protein
VSASFATQLRASNTPIQIAEAGDGAITFRVQAADIWEVVRVVARPETPLAEVKQRVIDRIFPDQAPGDFVLKLHGWEMLDEREALSAAGVVNGATLLLALRRRRPVR